MKRLLVLLLTAVTLTGCLAPAGPDWQTADEVVAMLKQAGLPIGASVSYSAETDPDQLLGTRGLYASKVVFQDTRLTPALQPAGSVEFFASRADMRRRAEAIRKAYEAGAISPEFQFRFYNVLLRLSWNLTPEQRMDYDGVLSDYGDALRSGKGGL